MARDGRERAVAAAAGRHDLSEAAVAALWDALERGGGRMAQFSHPDLGGMGQWSGGMVQIGAMFDHGLKARVAAACADLSAALAAEAGRGPGSGRQPASAARTSVPQVVPRRRDPGDWWPGDLGRPSASGAQSGLRYAVFAEARRLAVERDGCVTLYDTGRHRIFGASQRQGTDSDLAFTADDGTVRLADLTPLGDG